MGTIDTFPQRQGLRPVSDGTVALLIDLLLRLDDMLERHRSRKALLELSEEQLKDIGISRSDAIREATRPAWDYGRR